MTIDHRFHFLRMDFHAADVDHAISSADEVVAATRSSSMSPVSTKPSASGDRLVTPAPDSERRRGRSGSEASHPRLSFRHRRDRRRSDSRESPQTICHFKRHARLGRGESVGDSGLRVEGAGAGPESPGPRFLPTNGRIEAQSVLAAGLISARRQWEGVPEIWVTLAGAGANQKIRRRLVRARQHQRCAGQDRPQEYLKSAITANIVEGAPNDWTRPWSV